MSKKDENSGLNPGINNSNSVIDLALSSTEQVWRAKRQLKKLSELYFKTPKALLSEAKAYFEWADAHPWYKNELIKSGDYAGTIVQVPTVRPYTIKGFMIFCGLSHSYWRMFRKDCNNKPERENFLAVINYIEDVITTQKFEGAAVGAFNPYLISRDIGQIDIKAVIPGEDPDEELPRMTKEQIDKALENL